MKHLLFLTITFISLFTNAQTLFDLSTYAGTATTGYGIETDSDHFTNSGNVATPTNLTYLNENDTSFFHYTVSSIADGIGVGGSDSLDTLILDLAVASWNQSAAATYTISSKRFSYTHSNITGQATNYDTFKFLEGESDTIMIVVTAGTLAMDKLRITSTNDNVITNLIDPLSSSNTIVSNPVIDGSLSIDLNGLNASLELVSLDGNTLKEIEVKGSIEVNLNNLNSGIYILRDRNSRHFRKIMVK